MSREMSFDPDFPAPMLCSGFGLMTWETSQVSFMMKLTHKI